MIKSTVVLVEEHDEIPHGKILVQKIAEADRPEVEDAFGNKHKIECYIVMTEDTMKELILVLRHPEVRQVIKRFLPGAITDITVLFA